MSPLLLAVLIGLGVALGRAIVNWLVIGELAGALQDNLEERVRRAAALLPPECADDFMDEWLEELRALKDRPRRAIAFTRGLRAAVEEIARDARPETPAMALSPVRAVQTRVQYRGVKVRTVVRGGEREALVQVRPPRRLRWIDRSDLDLAQLSDEHRDALGTLEAWVRDHPEGTPASVLGRLLRRRDPAGSG